MCQQQLQTDNSAKNAGSTKRNTNEMKVTYSLKKALKALFKKRQQQQSVLQQKKVFSSLESLESFDNLRNSQMEQHFYEEIEDNSANEKLANMVAAAEEEEDVYVPVRFARTSAGTFFWTTNLQPVTNTIMPTADEDLLQPAYCYSSYQSPNVQYQDRWAQA